MIAELDPDFVPIARAIRESIGRQGFMALVGAELSGLSRGTCTLSVDRGESCCSSTASFTAASPPSWSTTRPRSRRQPRAGRGH